MADEHSIAYKELERKLQAAENVVAPLQDLLRKADEQREAAQKELEQIKEEKADAEKIRELKKIFSEPDADSEKQPFDFRPISKLPEETAVKIGWLIESLIPEQSITVIAGKGASFKTWTALDFANAIATGQKALKQFSTNKAEVLLIDEETGKYALKERLALLGVKFEDTPIHYISHEGFLLNQEAYAERLKNYLLEHPGIKLVIVDSLRRVLKGDENDSAVISDMMRAAKKLILECGVSWLFIHHERKGIAKPGEEVDARDSMRGSGDIYNSCDTALQAMRKGNAPLFVLTQTKNRFAQELDPLNVEIKEDEGVLELRCTGAAAKILTEQERASQELARWLYDYCKDIEEVKTATLVDAIKGSFGERIVEGAPTPLVAAGALEKLKRGVYKPIRPKLAKFLGIPYDSPLFGEKQEKAHEPHEPHGAHGAEPALKGSKEPHAGDALTRSVNALRAVRPEMSNFNEKNFKQLVSVIQQHLNQNKPSKEASTSDLEEAALTAGFTLEQFEQAMEVLKSEGSLRYVRPDVWGWSGP